MVNRPNANWEYEKILYQKAEEKVDEILPIKKIADDNVRAVRSWRLNIKANLKRVERELRAKIEDEDKKELSVIQKQVNLWKEPRIVTKDDWQEIIKPSDTVKVLQPYVDKYPDLQNIIDFMPRLKQKVEELNQEQEDKVIEKEVEETVYQEIKVVDENYKRQLEELITDYNQGVGSRDGARYQIQSNQEVVVNFEQAPKNRRIEDMRSVGVQAFRAYDEEYQRLLDDGDIENIAQQKVKNKYTEYYAFALYPTEKYDPLLIWEPLNQSLSIRNWESDCKLVSESFDELEQIIRDKASNVEVTTKRVPRRRKVMKQETVSKPKKWRLEVPEVIVDISKKQENDVLKNFESVKEDILNKTKGPYENTILDAQIINVYSYVYGTLPLEVKDENVGFASIVLELPKLIDHAQSFKKGNSSKGAKVVSEFIDSSKALYQGRNNKYKAFNAKVERWKSAWVALEHWVNSSWTNYGGVAENHKASFAGDVVTYKSKSSKKASKNYSF